MKKHIEVVAILIFVIIAFCGCQNATNADYVEKNHSNPQKEKVVEENKKTDSEKSSDEATFAKAYLKYIEEISKESSEECHYLLLYMDDDDVPELLITYQTNAGGRQLATYYDGNIVDEKLAFGELYYEEKCGLFMVETGCQGTYPTYIYKVKNGVFSIVAQGAMNEEMDGFTYEWEKEDVSEEEFNNHINQIFDKEHAKKVSDSCTDNYDEMVSILKGYQ